MISKLNIETDVLEKALIGLKGEGILTLDEVEAYAEEKANGSYFRARAIINELANTL